VGGLYWIENNGVAARLFILSIMTLLSRPQTFLASLRSTSSNLLELINKARVATT